MIALCPNPFRDIELNMTLTAVSMLEDKGFETAICPVFAEEEPDVIPQNIQTCDIHSVIDKCSLVIVIGGDGTMLSVARSIHGHNVPLLGLNLGTKGFMTALEPEDLPYIIQAVEGDLELSRRMKLDVSLVRDGTEIFHDCALNDAVIHGYGDCVKISAFCDDHAITSFSGDGVILSTPTGSTGYSMSAGGPIVEPDAENIILSPICAHVMGARSFVLAPTRTVTVKTEKLHGRRAYLAIDGNWVYDLANGDELIVKRSVSYTNMAHVGLRSFFDTAYEKLR